MSLLGACRENGSDSLGFFDRELCAASLGIDDAAQWNFRENRDAMLGESQHSALLFQFVHGCLPEKSFCAHHEPKLAPLGVVHKYKGKSRQFYGVMF
jgi:hypothetical protein